MNTIREIRARRANGEEFDCGISITPTVVKPDSPRIFTVVMRDITEREREREREIQELRQALAAQKTLTGWDESSITAGIAGVGSLRERDLESFTAIQTEYGLLLESYLKAVGLNDSPPRREISVLADRLGDLGVGPRDVIDLHTRVVAAKCQDVPPKRAKVYTVEGRLLALEVMGYLTDYYRMRTRTSRIEKPLIER